MTLTQLDTRILFFPNKSEKPDVMVLPSDSSVNVKWNISADNAQKPKDKVVIKVNGQTMGECDYNDLSYSLNGLKNSEIYSIETHIVYVGGQSEEILSFKTSPHKQKDMVVADDKGNGCYIITNMADVEKNVTVEAVYSNGNKSAVQMRLKAGEAAELKLFSSAEITVKET